MRSSGPIAEQDLLRDYVLKRPLPRVDGKLHVKDADYLMYDSLAFLIG